MPPLKVCPLLRLLLPLLVGALPLQLIAEEPITPLPLSVEVDLEKARLGEQLFHDVRLSRDNSRSCAHCHQLPNGGSDNQKVSTGIGAQQGKINAPTVFNSSLNFVQFWDGRARTLEEQLDGPISNPLELGSSWSEVVGKLRNDPQLVARFVRVYPQGLSAESIKESLASFERTLLTPNSRFDHYLRGNPAALSARERYGYQLFKEYGCASCHQGIAVGGNMYARMGAIYDYFEERGKIGEADYGRYNVTQREADRFTFKVPSLRLVAYTAPYFHDGSAATLEQAVRVMARYQLGRPIAEDDVAQIVEFLHTLSGDLNHYKGVLHGQ